MGRVTQGHTHARRAEPGPGCGASAPGPESRRVPAAPSSPFAPLQMAALGEARLREMEALRALRLANEGKLLAPGPGADTRVCLCHKAPAGPMVQCELCRDAFHTGCVAAPGAPHGPRVWLCPHCRRSEKPPLERVLPLLASLQRIRVRLPEGDALRYVIERTVSWQHRAQQLLASGGLRPAHDRGGPGRPQSRGPASAGPASDSKVSLSLRCWLWDPLRSVPSSGGACCCAAGPGAPRHQRPRSLPCGLSPLRGPGRLVCQPISAA